MTGGYNGGDSSVGDDGEEGESRSREGERDRERGEERRSRSREERHRLGEREEIETE